MTTLDRTIDPEADRPTRPRDLRPLWRMLLAIVIPLGPLGIAATRAVMPYWTNDDIETATGLMLAEPGRAEAMLWIVFFAYPLLLMGALGVAFAARRGAPRLATIGGLLTFVSFACVGSVGNGDGVMVAMSDAGFDQATVTRVVEAMYSHPTSAVSTGVFVVGHIVGLILLGIAVAKAGIVPTWVGAMIAVSQPIHFVSAVVVPSRLLDVVAGWGFTTIGFALVALAVLRRPVDELDLPPARRG